MDPHSDSTHTKPLPFGRADITAATPNEVTIQVGPRSGATVLPGPSTTGPSRPPPSVKAKSAKKAARKKAKASRRRNR